MKRGLTSLRIRNKTKENYTEITFLTYQIGKNPKVEHHTLLARW